MRASKTKLATVAELCAAYDRVQKETIRAWRENPDVWPELQKTMRVTRCEIDVLVDAAMRQIATGTYSASRLNAGVELSYFNAWLARRGGW